jgi:hypothetical protein
MAFFILGQEAPRALGFEPSMLWVLTGTVAGVGLVAGIAALVARAGHRAHAA